MILDYKQINDIADRGEAWGFNRQLEPSYFRALPKTTRLEVIGKMTHDYKNGERCETHWRLAIAMPVGLAFADVPREYLDGLEASEN